jgi:Family of unknown function (DUF6069)
MPNEIAWPRVPLAAAAAVVASAVACAVLFLIESALGVIDHSVSVPSMIGTGPVSIASVAVAAAVYSVLAAVVFAVIVAIGRRPIRVFLIVSVVALVLSLALPATVPGPSPAMRLGLALMHVVTWAIDVTILTTVARRPAVGESAG